MIISLDLEDRSRRRLRDCSRLPTLASSLQTVESEIAAGRIALFSPFVIDERQLSLLLSRSGSVPIWTVNVTNHASPAFTGHPCSMQLGLSSDPRGASDHSSLPYRQRIRMLRSTSPSCGDGMQPISGCVRDDAVPKGRFELPRGYPHYALNVARLPFRHFGLLMVAREEPRSRPPDSNRRPAVYETAALPTELGRQCALCERVGV
jgi:hypothetical protein